MLLCKVSVILQIRNCTNLNNHQPEYAKAGTNLQLACRIWSDIITSEFDSQLVMKQGGQMIDKNPQASSPLTHIFNFLKSCPIDLIMLLTGSPWS
jgi:hypothetical protein